MIDGSASGEPLSCGNQSTYNRVANAGNLYRLSPFQMPFGILHNLTGEISLTFPLEKSHFITALGKRDLLWDLLPDAVPSNVLEVRHGK